MCGIVGVAGNLNRERLTTVVNAMNAAITHRGPDDEGTWAGDHFAFGMRRLSIIDLAGGHQPMWDSRTGTGIVYNGEVYNYRAIRLELEETGIRFQTTSDTEVVLQDLVLKGKRAVHDWDGMFAIATWNDRDKKLLLIRDRIGVKPLYYFWNGSILLFASEIKALLASGLVPRQLNRQAIWDYLTYRYIPGPETIWHNVWKLPPAHMLEWAPAGEPRISRYWDTDVVSGGEPIDIDRKTKEFEDLFLDSVELRLLASDVPVGVMLSGGLDSSAVAAAAIELGHKRFHTFTVGFSDGGEYSELGYAKQVADHLGVEFHDVVVDKTRFLEMLPEAVRFADEPLADLTTVPLLAVSRLARERVKVVLSGEGSDEILAGYDLNLSRKNFETIRRLQMLPRWLLTPAGHAVGMFSARHGDRLRRVASIPLSKWNLEHKNHMTWMYDEIEKRKLWPGFNGLDSGRLLRAMYGAARSQDPIDQILRVYQQSWLVEDLLMKADKMTMGASLELRVPFLDYRLVEWANRQPIGVKIGDMAAGSVTKHVLRRFAEKRLPREIIDRPKRGFPVPVYGWLKDEAFHRWMRDHIAGRHARLNHLFEPAQMQRLTDQAAAGNTRAAHQTWLLAVLETWLRAFDVVIDAETPAPLIPSLVANSGANS